MLPVSDAMSVSSISNIAASVDIVVIGSIICICGENVTLKNIVCIELMENQIIDVEYDDGAVDLCKVISQHVDYYTVKPLVYDSDIYLYKFSHYTHHIPIESVSGFYDTINLEDTGRYIKVDGIHYKSTEDSDPEYEYDTGSSDTDSGSEISLYDELEYEFE